MYVCSCAAVTSAQIKERIRNGTSLKDLQRELRVACACCMCVPTLKEMLKTEQSSKP